MSRADGWCIWITGLPGSGKSVVSEALLKLFNQKGAHAQLLSSGVLRKVLTPKPTYSLGDVPQRFNFALSLLNCKEASS